MPRAVTSARQVANCFSWCLAKSCVSLAGGESPGLLAQGPRNVAG